MVRLIQAWIDLRSSLWFVPALIVLGAVGLALALIEADKRLGGELDEAWPRLFGAGAEGSRAMLAAIAGSMITVAGVTFSVTIVAVAQASHQYTPRILRNFMRDRGNQVVIGVFVGVFAYCLLVLRSVRGGEDLEFVPSLAVLVGALLALVGVGVLLYFIHHITRGLLASTIIAGVARETTEVIDALFPDPLRDDAENDDALAGPPGPGGDWQPVPAADTGYVEVADTEALLSLASEMNAIARMEAGIGEFVVEGQPLVSLAGGRPVGEPVRKRVNQAFAIEPERSIEQDPGFGIQQLVDIAVKALSPSMNDTTTAVVCIDFLSAILVHLAGRRIDSALRFERGRLRLIVRRASFAEFVAAAFDPIRREARSNVTILARLVEALETVCRAAPTEGRRRVVQRQLAALLEMAERTLSDPQDRARILTRVGQTLEDRRRVA